MFLSLLHIVKSVLIILNDFLIIFLSEIVNILAKGTVYSYLKVEFFTIYMHRLFLY